MLLFAFVIFNTSLCSRRCLLEMYSSTLCSLFLVLQDFTSLNRNMEMLQNALERYSDSRNVVSHLTPEDDGKEMLVPLTNTLYVPGKLVKPDELLVDVGAGYFVPKSVEGATVLL